MRVILSFLDRAVQSSHTTGLDCHTLVWLDNWFIPALGAAYKIMGARLAAEDILALFSLAGAACEHMVSVNLTSSWITFILVTNASVLARNLE